jgi:hypothetical protein
MPWDPFTKSSAFWPDSDSPAIGIGRRVSDVARQAAGIAGVWAAIDAHLRQLEANVVRLHESVRLASESISRFGDLANPREQATRELSDVANRMDPRYLWSHLIYPTSIVDLCMTESGEHGIRMAKSPDAYMPGLGVPSPNLNQRSDSDSTEGEEDCGEKREIWKRDKKTVGRRNQGEWRVWEDPG